jgi:SRSO17 transposase
VNVTELYPLTLPQVRAVDESIADRLERYLDPFRAEFRRRDQARWAAVYLQGLLRPGPRKNVENLARAVTLPADLTVEDAAQALQHFINQSPWEEDRLWRRHWALVNRGLPSGSALVVDELAFIKQGRHSVGVQRQFSRSLGRKVNCQLAVVLHLVHPGGLIPLALRLYLPRGWLSDTARLNTAGVPESVRQIHTKTTIAQSLLESVLGANVRPSLLTASAGWSDSNELADVAARHGLDWSPTVPPELQDALTEGTRQLLVDLGMGHFEGRSWRGFHHHACLVMLAHAFPSSDG